jgi:hypothetical protein
MGGVGGAEFVADGRAAGGLAEGHGDVSTIGGHSPADRRRSSTVRRATDVGLPTDGTTRDRRMTGSWLDRRGNRTVVAAVWRP